MVIEYLKFNSENLNDEFNQIKIHIHDKVYMSPNNAAFNLRFTRPLSSFGLVIAYQKPQNGQYTLFIEWYDLTF